jgi:hypothetical protein
MHRPILSCAFVLVGTLAFAQQQPADQQPAQQQPAQSDQYQGQSNPPADDVIVTAPQDQPQPVLKAKPRAGKLAAPPAAQSAAQAPDAAVQEPPVAAPPKADGMPVQASENQAQPDEDSGQTSQTPEQTQDGSSAQVSVHPSSVDPSVNYPDPDVTGTDDGIVGIAKPEPQEAAGAQPMLRSRVDSGDADGDIVNPHPLAPGELPDGTTIRVHLLTRLSTVDTQPGEMFRTRVATDVLQDGQVLIPAGAEIDGRVMQVESGTMRSHGTMLLRPETVTLLDGTRFHLDAQVTGAPGTRARISGEGYINPGSRFKKDSVEYGGGVGAGVVVGAMVAGPVGAVTGGIIGAGAITVHVLANHSDATLEPGTVLLFTLNNRLDLRASANSTGN